MVPACELAAPFGILRCIGNLPVVVFSTKMHHQFQWTLLQTLFVKAELVLLFKRILPPQLSPDSMLGEVEYRETSNSHELRSLSTWAKRLLEILPPILLSARWSSPPHHKAQVLKFHQIPGIGMVDQPSSREEPVCFGFSFYQH